METPRSVCSESCIPGYRKAVLPGHPSCCFECLPCPEGEIANETDMNICLKCQDEQWPNLQRDTCIPRMTEYLSYDEPLGTILASICSLLSVTTVSVLFIFIKYRNTPIVKANNRNLSYILLMSLIMCFLCAALFIGLPKKVTCFLRQAVFGMIFTICISTVLAKTVTVVIAFKATKPDSTLRKWISPRVMGTIAPLCTFVQAIICIVWLTADPPFLRQDIKSKPGTIIIECAEDSPVFYCMMGYLGCLAVMSFIVAFLARKLPDAFNDAKFITFSMLVFVCVWMSFVPAYLSTKGKYLVAVEVFAILASAGGILACIFSPKCYIIVMKPEMNTREQLIGKPKK
ncbi:vomeronasal type-2 receptor 26-like [Protopterus annectens]|uniref:vomeronasal type-2 receptor 26-like n=1 Tax=Protopterus annectens TaxID=7888 RepID=UPI001CFBF619|nr:vomeronasal type-2 receptor 26-like [Protopterus annectens]